MFLAIALAALTFELSQRGGRPLLLGLWVIYTFVWIAAVAWIGVKPRKPSYHARVESETHIERATVVSFVPASGRAVR
jgi:hypothetical protein